MRHQLGILISGGGTTMQAIIQACRTQIIPDMQVNCVISSSETAGGLIKASNLHISQKNLVVINPNDYREPTGLIDQQKFGEALLTHLHKRNITIVAQNGWLPLTPANVINAYEDNIFNQHPGPVPEFGGKGMYGLRVYAARLYFAREVDRDWKTLAIAQRVCKKFDQGAVVKFHEVDIYRGDTPESLQTRALPAEHQVQVELLKDVVNGKVREVKREISFVRSGEEELLKKCKEKAIKDYPNA